MISDKKQIVNKIKQTMYIPPKGKAGSFDIKDTLLELLLEVNQCVEKGINFLDDKKRK